VRGGFHGLYLGRPAGQTLSNGSPQENAGFKQLPERTEAAAVATPLSLNRVHSVAPATPACRRLFTRRTRPRIGPQSIQRAVDGTTRKKAMLTKRAREEDEDSIMSGAVLPCKA